MNAHASIDVGTLDVIQRRALEEMLGRPLEPNERLIVQSAPVAANGETHEAAQICDLLAHFYDGLSEDEIEAIDRQIKLRADLTRPSS